MCQALDDSLYRESVATLLINEMNLQQYRRLSVVIHSLTRFSFYLLFFCCLWGLIKNSYSTFLFRCFSAVFFSFSATVCWHVSQIVRRPSVVRFSFVSLFLFLLLLLVNLYIYICIYRERDIYPIIIFGDTRCCARSRSMRAF